MQIKIKNISTIHPSVYIVLRMAVCKHKQCSTPSMGGDQQLRWPDKPHCTTARFTNRPRRVQAIILPPPHTQIRPCGRTPPLPEFRVSPD